MNNPPELGAPGATILNVPYGPLPAQTLDVYRPPAPSGGLPAVLMLHGGGWRIGDKARFAAAAMKFAAAGIVAVSANYRLVDPAIPATAWPAQWHDAAAALAWLKAHAAALHADPAQITAMGSSAGGHLAHFAGLPATIDGHARPPSVAGVISLSGPTDLLAMCQTRPGMIRSLLAHGSPAGLYEAAKAASPITYVGRGAAPVLLLHGIADPAVPFAGALAYFEALRRADVPAWLLTHSGGHLLQGAPAKLRASLMQAQIGFVRHRRLDAPPGRQDFGSE